MEQEASQQFIQEMIVVLQWMPYITAGFCGLLLLQAFAWCWYRERLHRTGKLHREYDGLDAGYTLMDALKGKPHDDSHLWERDIRLGHDTEAVRNYQERKAIEESFGKL